MTIVVGAHERDEAIDAETRLFTPSYGVRGGKGMYCSTCGTVVTEDLSYCNRCGAEVGEKNRTVPLIPIKEAGLNPPLNFHFKVSHVSRFRGSSDPKLRHAS